MMNFVGGKNAMGVHGTGTCEVSPHFPGVSLAPFKGTRIIVYKEATFAKPASPFKDFR